MAGNLYDWAKFCRWLTHEWRGDDESWQCYPDPESPEEDGNGDPVYGDMLLDRGGFRMPTEAECQLAARSGQRTPYAFGGATSLLSDYGWFAENTENNRPCATGLKLPTIGGLFDAHGNMNEWAHDWYNVMDGKSVKEDPVGAWGAHRSLDRSLFRSLEMTPQGLGGANRIA